MEGMEGDVLVFMFDDDGVWFVCVSYFLSLTLFLSLQARGLGQYRCDVCSFSSFKDDCVSLNTCNVDFFIVALLEASIVWVRKEKKKRDQMCNRTWIFQSSTGIMAVTKAQIHTYVHGDRECMHAHERTYTCIRDGRTWRT